ncbi:MAG: hypothetical protein ILA06_06120 [Bacteroidaceae bacterium]|nr:hypothetical protein [Bacteroidaceae bacterium]
MAAERITYPNKYLGDLFYPEEANLIKAAANEHADELDALQQARISMANEVSALQTNVGSLLGGISVIAQTSTSVSIDPNVLNRWATPVSSLTIGFNAGVSGKVNEYMLEFTAGEGFMLTLPGSVRWVEEPEWESGHTYQVSIVAGLALYAGWEAAGS